MPRVSLPLALALLVTCLGCGTDEPGSSSQPTPPGDDTSTDDDDAVDDDDATTPPVVVGEVVDAVSGDGVGGVEVVELGTEPPNSATSTDDGAFQLTPEGWSPLQLFSPAEGRLLASIALTERTGAASRGFVQLRSWTTEAGADWVESTFGAEWAAGVGVLALEFTGLAPESAVGISAELSAVHGGGYVHSDAGNWIIAEAVPEGSLTASIVFVGVTAGITTITVDTPDGVTCQGAGSMEIFGDSTNLVPFDCEVAAAR